MVLCGACASASFGSFFSAHEASVSGEYPAGPVVPPQPTTLAQMRRHFNLETLRTGDMNTFVECDRRSL